MPASNLTAFDTIAADYDQTFSQSLTGHCQRAQVRNWLSAFLENKKQLNILEINCGTGDDAAWLASLGHRVTATDASGAMIQIARAKSLLHASAAPVRFIRCAFTDLSSVLPNEKFDLVFSNFSGLNCVPAGELSQLNDHFFQLLNPGGYMSLVVFGKYSWWETLYYLLRFDSSKAFRRWKKKTASSQLKEGVIQPVYYYSISRLLRLLNRFSLKEKKPVGLFIPPSYMESFVRNHSRLFRFLKKAEEKAGGIGLCSQLADHCYLLLKKK